MPRGMHVVGIGASAGGLEAIIDFFDYLPANTGMAFIVVQHLSPDHKSLMDELLSKHTQMPIEVVTQERPLQPNHIYLISAQSNVELENGRLKPVSRTERRRLNLPIDQFFHSLGEECKEEAIGIILSGTGTDGSRGIRTIKDNGGIILVQDPESAQFDGMPNAAIMTGIVDQVLPSADIAKMLTSILKRVESGLLLLDSEDKDLDDQLEAILNSVERYAEIDFRDYRRSTLLRRIEKRMLLLRLDNLNQYIAHIEENPQEAHILYREFLIGVTQFFRDPAAFELLRKEVLPNIISQKAAEQPLRIWCAGCSTGEEAYTLAILLEEYRNNSEQPFEYKIFASDLDPRAIATANRSVYPASIIDSIPPVLLDRYFTQTLEGYAVQKTLRERIVFTIHDALADPPFINMDLVSCRNLLIYINVPSQQILLNNFQFALREGGYLFLGPSESLGEIKENYVAVSERWNIFQLLHKSRLGSGRSYRLPRLLQRSFVNRSSTARNNEFSTSVNDHNSQSDLFQQVLLRQYVPLVLFVNPELAILHSYGPLHRVFTYPATPDDFNLRRLTSIENLAIFESGILRVKETGRTFDYEDVPFHFDDKTIRLSLRFQPITMQQRLRELVMIEIKILGEGPTTPSVATVDEDTFRREQLQSLERRLQSALNDKRMLTEKLEATNEELQSSNEELLAANEELQSTNEELQSVNEELYTVNAELQNKVQELTVSNTDLDSLLASTEIGTIFVDRELRLRKFTPVVRDQFNLLASDLGRPINSFVNNFSDERLYEDLEHVIETGEQVERQLQDKNGEVFLLRVLPYIIHPKQKIEGAVMTFTNVTPLHAAIGQREEQADRFAALSRHHQAGIAIVDEHDTIIEANRMVFGQASQALIAKSIASILSTKQYKKQYLPARQEAIANRAGANFRVALQDKEGSAAWYACTLVPVYDDNELRYFLLLCRDETVAQRILEETQRKVEIFNAIYEHTRQHIVITSPDGVVEDINYTGAGYTKQDLIGKPMSATYPDEIKGPFEQARKSLNAGEESVYFKTEFSLPDGTRYVYENMGLRIDLPDAATHSLVWVSREVTEETVVAERKAALEKKLEAQMEEHANELLTKNRELREINQYLDNFVHSAAHDLRAPVAQLTGLLEVATTTLPDDMQKTIQQNMQAAVKQLKQTIDGLVEMIDFQHQENTALTEVNLADLIAETLEALRRDFSDVEMDIELDLDTDLTITYLKPYARSLIHNLLHNAVKYRSFSRKLCVEVTLRRENATTVLLSVKDNGIGMDLNRYGHLLFEPFKRLTVERPGTGIGLSIVKNAIERNGGRIEVSSKLNKGAEFKAYLVAYAKK